MARSSPPIRSTDKALGRHPAPAPVSERGIKNTGTDEFRTILEACDPRKNRLTAELLVPMASTSPSSHGMSAKTSAQEVPCRSRSVPGLLDVDWLRTQSDLRPDDSHWLMLAKTSLSDELSTLQCHIAVAIHSGDGGEQADADEAVREWSGRNQSRIEQYRANIDQLRQATEVDLAMLSVAVEGLRRLLYATTTSDVTHN